MRITGGNASGRNLKVPKGFDVRPTPNLVKQAVFNSLGERVLDAQVLELFAGSGALSLESLSRGAAHALCIEKAQRHAHAIRQNSTAAGLGEQRLEVRVQDVFTALAQLAAGGKQFDLILADPPYGEKNVNRRSNSLAQKLWDDPHLPQVLKPGGLFVLGHTKRDTLEMPTGWSELKVLKHGDSVMRILSYAAPTVSPGF